MNDSIYLKQYLKKDPRQNDIAGQLLMLGFDGTKFSSDIKFLIQKLKIGGVILFKRNIEGPGQVHDLCMAMQEAALSADRPPLFIAVDQEGGSVARLKKPLFDEYPGASAVKSLQEAEEITNEMSAVLKRLGFNMNMAPVLDIAFDPENSIMKGRAYSDTPNGASEFGKAVIRGFQKNGIMAVGKHFPGIGRTTLDSHLTLPVLDIDENTLCASDLLPFRSAMDEEVAGLMISHILYKKIDPDWPASLSAVISNGILRKKMGYDGLVMTDDLDMKAINFDIKTCVSRIIGANIDIALICSRNSNQETALDEIMRLMRNDKGINEKAMDSARRIGKAKNRFIKP